MSNSSHTTPPNPELIAAFVDGGLEGEELQRVEALVADDPNWRAIFLETRELEDLELEDLELAEEVQEDPGLIRNRESEDTKKAPAPSIVRPSPATSDRNGTSKDPRSDQPNRPSKPPVLASPGGQVVALPASQMPENRLWLAVAAAIVLLGITAPYWLRLTQPGPTRSGMLLVAAADDAALARISPDWALTEWSNARGNTPAVSETTDFRIGVLSLKLALAQRLGEREQVVDFARQISSELRRSESLTGQLTADALTPSLTALRAPDSSNTARLEATEQIDDILHQTFADSDAYRLARWAWASLLAARVGNDTYFSSRDYRRDLEFARGLPLSAERIELVEEIAEAGRAGDSRAASAALLQLTAELGAWNTDVFERDRPPSD